MAASKDVCKICNKAFHGKKKFLKCCGPCAIRFHLSCLQISDAEYAYYMDSGVSTYKCAECVKLLRVQRNDDTPVKTRSASASDVPRKVVSPDRSLVIPPVFESDKFEALSVQVETVRLNGVCTLYLIESLTDMVTKLCGEVDHLKNDNAYLKQQLKNLQDAFQASNVGHQSQPTQVFSNKEIVERSVPPQSVSSYRDIVLRSQNTLQARAVSSAKNVKVCNSAPQGAVVSKGDAASEVIPETGSSATADGDYVLVARKKWRDVGMATPPVNPKHGEN